MAHLPHGDEEMALDPARAVFQWLFFQTGFRQIFFFNYNILLQY